MKTASRTICSNIFKTRARMLQIKDNFKSAHTNMNCRWCEQQQRETQIHILTECKGFADITKNITSYNTYFNTKDTQVQKVATTLEKVMEN
jgi:hypothetical protein